jgi:hypothetical protein
MAQEGEQVQTQEAPAAPAAGVEGQPSGADEFAGFDDESKKRVSEIVSKRVNEVNAKYKPYEAFGKPEDVQARLSRAEQIEKWAEQMRSQFQGKVPGQALPETPQLTEEDKKVQAYIEKIYPGLSSFRQQQAGLTQRLQQLDQWRMNMVTENNRAYFRDLATKAGYQEAHLAELEQRVADSIGANEQERAAYLQSGGRDVVKKHFEAIDKWIKGYQTAAPPPPAPQAQYAQKKAATEKLAPRMPPGGVTAPTAGKKKLTDEERITAAHAALQEALK